MGPYNLTLDEFVEKFEDFLQNLEGDISPELIIEAWNKLNDKYKWNEKIVNHAIKRG